jgi:nucleoside-triphosphatase
VDSGLHLAGGFSTEEIRALGRRLGFKVQDLHSGARGTLAHVDFKGGPRVGKYGVDVPSFERIGVAALEAARRRAGCIVIDEIGKMELFSQRFREVATDILDSARTVLATLPVHKHPFLNQLRHRADIDLIEVTPSNRDDLPRRLLETLKLARPDPDAQPGP